MPEITRNKDGEWCVAVEVDRMDYMPVHGKRKLYRIPVDRDATAQEALSAARAVGMMPRA